MDPTKYDPTQEHHAQPSRKKTVITQIDSTLLQTPQRQSGLQILIQMHPTRNQGV